MLLDASDLFPFVVLAIVLAAILGSVAKRWMKLKEKQLELAATVAGEQAAQYATKIERLESHVATLNRIVTDRNEGLAVQIETLRDGPATKLN
ncbi:hypothetical protein GCM10011529_17380 [Polymorphobacter glacialis]|uniref:Uncharacterized protein n=1 Tax=Sandarakinorhabdus glacialis TaxID=1614636 RepID=A0A917E7E8_9SPHN|nr:hypothetical protein [Polymorphobacter glacialis]GGE11573.1 hypothetical protein GCM10011529_17380 [Polymorphobacter glacialis]